MSAVTTATPQGAASGKLLQYAWVFVPVALTLAANVVAFLTSYTK